MTPRCPLCGGVVVGSHFHGIDPEQRCDACDTLADLRGAAVCACSLAALRRALAEQAAGEAERTAQAEMARDVAWVIAIDSQCGGADVDDGIACATAEALGVTERVALRLLDGSPTTDEHIAAAIRAARGAK